jgi:NTP pyrophosphatase (non-canonical NTP hydrolase)
VAQLLSNLRLRPVEWRDNCLETAVYATRAMWVGLHFMDIQELTTRMHQFVGSKGWYAGNSSKPQTPRNLAASLAIEAAEVLEHFQWRENSADNEALAGELADVALYLLQLASISGIDLEQAILDKLALNQSREWPDP